MPILTPMFVLQTSLKISQNAPLLTILVIAVTSVVSILAFRKQDLFRKLLFEVEPILSYKEYWRVFTSGLVHIGWMHLIMNMVVLFFFGEFLELQVGHWQFLVIYIVSLGVSSLVSLFIHRNHADYSAGGASGGVAGIIYTYIMLVPEGALKLYFVIEVPNWLFGIGYIAWSLYGIRNKHTRVGHEAHLGGALCGAIIGIILNPGVLVTHWWMVLLMVVPVLIFYILFLRNPAVLGIKGYYKTQVKNRFKGRMKVVKSAIEPKISPQEELDLLLEKISDKGMEGLSRKEKRRLEDLSQAGRTSDIDPNGPEQT